MYDIFLTMQNNQQGKFCDGWDLFFFLQQLLIIKTLKNEKSEGKSGNTKIYNWKRLLPTTSDNLFQVHILKIKANLEYKPVWPELELFQNQS